LYVKPLNVLHLATTNVSFVCVRVDASTLLGCELVFMCFLCTGTNPCDMVAYTEESKQTKNKKAQFFV